MLHTAAVQLAKSCQTQRQASSKLASTMLTHCHAEEILPTAQTSHIPVTPHGPLLGRIEVLASTTGPPPNDKALNLKGVQQSHYSCGTFAGHLAPRASCSTIIGTPPCSPFVHTCATTSSHDCCAPKLLMIIESHVYRVSIDCCSPNHAGGTVSQH